MNKNPLVHLHDWKVYTNRARSIVEPSIRAAESFIQTQHAAIRYVCHKYIQQTTLTYYDTYRGNGKPSVPEPEVDTPFAVRLLPRPITNQLSDKVKLARSIAEHNLFEYAPKTYFSLDEATQSGGDPNRLLFVKLRSGTRGEHVSCVKYSELPSLELSPDHIIQEGINNPALFMNRKTVFRFYIFIFDGAVYISKHGVVIVHGEDYDPNSTDYKIHVQHNGEGAEPIKFPLAHLPYSHTWIDALKNLTRALLPVLEVARKDSSLFRYLLIGADGMPCEDGKVRLIEMNAHPSLVRAPMIEPVYVPVFSSMMLMVVPGLNDNTWVRIV